MYSRVTPRSKVKLVAKMLKAIHAQENKRAAREKAKAVVEELRSMKLKEAAKKVEDGIEETLTYCDFPSEHWTRIRTNNVMERLNRRFRRRTRVVGSFPDGNSALMLVCARLRHVAGTQWGNKKYMNMKHLEAALRMPLLLDDFTHARTCKPFCEKYLTLPFSFLWLIGWGGGLPPHFGQKKSRKTVSDFLLGDAASGRRVFSFESWGQVGPMMGKLANWKLY